MIKAAQALPLRRLNINFAHIKTMRIKQRGGGEPGDKAIFLALLQIINAQSCARIFKATVHSLTIDYRATCVYGIARSP